eukprot:6211789-Pleurochrysis_carterae.AAC.3
MSSCRILRSLLSAHSKGRRCLALPESLDDVDAFQLEVKKCIKQKEDAHRRGFGSCRKDFVKVNSRSLTAAVMYPARFASFKGTVDVERVGEDPLGLQTSVFFARSTRSRVLFATVSSMRTLHPCAPCAHCTRALYAHDLRTSVTPLLETSAHALELYNLLRARKHY